MGRHLNICHPNLRSTLPDLRSTQPDLCSTQSDLRSTQPDLCSTQSDLQSAQPDLCSTQPDLCSTQPDLRSTQPDLRSTQSDLQSAQPDLCSTQPDLQSAQPDLCSTQPDLRSTQPDLRSTQRDLQSAQPDLQPPLPDIQSALPDLQSNLHPALADHPYSCNHTAPPKTPRHVKCPHCTLVLYKKNLALHIQRQHGLPKDITAKSHLKGTCVDQSKGLYAVRKTSCGFSVPIHVQRKTWGQTKVTRCEMEDCRQYHLLAQRSGLTHSTCHHIRSIEYCNTSATEVPLQQQVLDKMLLSKFFNDSKVAVCKHRQKEAENAQAPLCVLVELRPLKHRTPLHTHTHHHHHKHRLLHRHAFDL
ncbi:uncharacterized protein LOC121695442 [Alosa sapidissima]|uniref:uncharacterized protein LOC121695442 n=1 Tax=Alosa sapidissima TaxID=34773 RepID=UPI001C08BD95|nr:uncharacterized protein LOC121695442 [Alosa sapidissima]